MPVLRLLLLPTPLTDPAAPGGASLKSDETTLARCFLNGLPMMSEGLISAGRRGVVSLGSEGVVVAGSLLGMVGVEVRETPVARVVASSMDDCLRVVEGTVVEPSKECWRLS